MSISKAGRALSSVIVSSSRLGAVKDGDEEKESSVLKGGRLVEDAWFAGGRGGLDAVGLEGHDVDMRGPLYRNGENAVMSSKEVRDALADFDRGGREAFVGKDSTHPEQAPLVDHAQAGRAKGEADLER